MQTPRMWKDKTMKQKEAFADLEKTLAAIDFRTELAALDAELQKVDFSDLERQLQEIDLDFLLQ